jgi:hypothetical protein
MRAYALVELGDSEAIELFLREENASRVLGECLSDEPDWVGVLFVEVVELDVRSRVDELAAAGGRQSQTSDSELLALGFARMTLVWRLAPTPTVAAMFFLCCSPKGCTLGLSICC